MRKIARTTRCLLTLSILFGTADPALASSVVWSTCVGSASVGGLVDMAVDDEGNTYSVSNFETFQPFDEGFIVTKLDPEGSRLFSKFYSFAPWAEEAHAIAVGPDHGIYVGGLMSEFPQSEFVQGFVVKLDPSGSPVVYYTTLFDGSFSVVEDLAVDAEGRAYAILSGDFRGQFSLWRLSANGLAERFGPDLSAELVAVDAGSGGDVFVAGISITDANEYEAAMVARISSSGALVYRALLSKDGLLFWPTAVVAAPGGGAYLTGYTGSPGDPEDAFVARFGATGALVEWRLLGGSGEESGSSIAVTPSGDVLVAGSTNSPDFPLRDPQSSDPAGFLVRLDAALSIQEATILGGSLVAVGTDLTGGVYVAGFSSQCPGPFVARLALGGAPVCSAATASPSVIWPPNGKMVPVSIAGVTDLDGDPVTVTITGITQDEPLAGKGPDASGVGASAAQVRASRAGGGDGRVYHITFTATDPQGASCAGTVAVCVPHDQRRGSICGDGGALFDATRR